MFYKLTSKKHQGSGVANLKIGVGGGVYLYIRVDMTDHQSNQF